jgi:hypothetical protein
MNKNDSELKGHQAEGTASQEPSPVPLKATEGRNEAAELTGAHGQNPVDLRDVSAYALLLSPEIDRLSRGRRFKKWFKTITVAEVGMFILTLVMVGATINYARYAKHQLEAVIKSNALTQSSLNISQQSYVTIGRQDGAVAEIVWPKDSKGKAGILVYFQNNGHLPAKFNWGPDSKIIAVLPADPNALKDDQMGNQWIPFETDHEFSPMWRAKNRKTGGFGWSGTVMIAGNSAYQGLLWELPKERMLQLIKWDRPFVLSGKFEYCNGFRKRFCNRFNISYAREPYNRFFLTGEDECVAYEMQVFNHDPDFDYLPPCETGEDREELRTTFHTLPNP